MQRILFIVIILRTFLFSAEISKEDYLSLEVFTNVLNKIKESYLEEVDQKKLIYAAIKGMVGELDPHSQYYPPDEYNELKQDTTGFFGGLGFELSIKENELIVVAAIDNSPAFKAGIKSKDQIIKIDDAFVKDLSVYECTKRLKGKVGTKIRLSIKRKNVKELIVFNLVRERIREQSVKFKDLNKGFAYFRIIQFQEATAIDFKKFFSDFYKGNNGKIKGIIIDLRINPGGIFDKAVEIADMFLESGEIVSMGSRKNPESKQVFNASKGHDFLGFPISILVDEGSASASEILAGALQDHKRAKIIGEKSFGKGTVQKVESLPDGSGLKLTIAEFYTPSHKPIQMHGITPDIKVALLEDNGDKNKKVKDTEKEKEGEDDIKKMLEKDNQFKEAYNYITKEAGK